MVGYLGWLFCIQYCRRRSSFYSVVILAQAGIQRLVVLRSISRMALHVLLCCHPRASGDPEVGCFDTNITEGATRFTLFVILAQAGIQRLVGTMAGAARLFFGYPFRPLQFAPLGLLEAAFIGYPRALVGRQPWIPVFTGMTYIFLVQCLYENNAKSYRGLAPTLDPRFREDDVHFP